MQAGAGFKLGGGGLQLGTQSGQSTGLQLGGGQQTAAADGLAAGGLKLGGAGGLQLGQSPATGGLQLGQSTGGLKLGQTQTSGVGQAGGLGGLQLGGLGTQATKPAGGLQLGQVGGLPPPSYSAATHPTSSAAPGGLQLGGLSAQKPAGGLQLGGLGAMQPASSAAPGGLQLGGLSAQKPAGGLQLGGLGTTQTTKPLQLGTAAVNSGLQLGAPKPQVTGATQLGGLGSSKPGGGLQLGGGLTAATSTGPSLGGLAASQAKPGSLGTPSIGGLKTGAGLKTATSAAVTTTTSGATPFKKYTYKELEGLVNKWTLELQAQEKLFLQQADQVNKWDRVLAENGDKIVELNSEVERVKSEQERVDNELDMIQAQQKELEDLLTQLESRVDHAPTHGGLHADMQRTKTFQAAENIDSQLKQMSGDLKMIIEQMNESNTSSDEDNPFTQIVRILNAHTDSLGWIDHEAALLRKKVDDVAKVTDYHRQEQELSFRKLAFSHQ